MRASRTVPARHGWFWLARGFFLFRKNPPMWTLLVFTYWILVALVNQIPIAGPLAATLFLPAFSVSFMAICRQLDRGDPLLPILLFAGFRARLPTLVTLGALYLLSILLVLGISALADHGALAHWVIYGTAPSAEVIRDGSLSSALIIAAAAGTPVVMAFWFAPVLAAWDGMGAPKALFFSFFASWRNWRAFLLYGAVLALAGTGLSVALVAAALLLRGHPELLRLGLIAAILVTMPTLFGSFYAAYCDVFPNDAIADEARV
ncbi:MAG: hypothetical protein A2V78_13105 [Betaproteobacteria bacterium RBG_16_64_18]|nr:MAG: hypothetical protein A2V78_13105 [Betaproteobacteria bacterium RBG_16_64_18]OGA13205.1 MAG: hypothetical protein A3H33_00300 [Betaproteobacteria bacterium RIFCSPLOWO2_02_FULL_65_20]OGA43173.1 MAG: hypothetical protein A3G26_11600 [Betaproteobacteria bacterium RIFCSPLOWO2_12_FULL_65_110]